MSKYIMFKQVFDGNGWLTIIPSVVIVTVILTDDGDIMINFDEPEKGHFAEAEDHLFQEMFGLYHKGKSINDFASDGYYRLANEVIREVTDWLEAHILSAINDPSVCYKLNLCEQIPLWREYFYQRATSDEMKRYIRNEIKGE